MKPLEERFWSKTYRTPEPAACWEWRGYVALNGYGHFTDKRLPTRAAHRIAWLLMCGPIPAGKDVCHHCDNRRCVRPSHLFLGSRSDNMQDCSTKGRLRFQPGLAAARLNPRKYHNGSRNHAAKLSEDSVSIIKAIRPRCILGIGALLAREFGVSETLINTIQRGNRWPHVEPDPKRALSFLKAKILWKP